jgi:SLAP domain-containing protein
MEDVQMENKDTRKDIELELSLKPDKEELMLKFEKDLMLEDLTNFPTIKEGDVSFKSAYIFDNGVNIEVAVYILNGLPIQTNFEEIPFLLVDSEGKIIVQQIFDMSDVGIIPPNSARPCKIYFDKSNLLVDKFPAEGCKLIVDKNIKALNTVQVHLENMTEDISQVQVKKYESYLENLPLLRKGEVNISTYDINVLKDGSVCITLFIRNATLEKIKVEELPITIFDGEGNKIASEIFKIENIEVNPSKARLYNFMLSKQELLMDEFNHENLTVHFKKL